MIVHKINIWMKYLPYSFTKIHFLNSKQFIDKTWTRIYSWIRISFFTIELKAKKILNIPNQSPKCLHEIYHKQGMPQWKCQVVVIGQRMRSNIYFKHASNISALFGWLTFVITWNETMKIKYFKWIIFKICQIVILKTLK